MNNNIFDIFEDVRQLITECSTTEVQAKMSASDKFLLIDIRENHEWLAGHLPNAIHIRRAELCNEIGIIAPDKNQVIVLYWALLQKIFMAKICLAMGRIILRSLQIVH